MKDKKNSWWNIQVIFDGTCKEHLAQQLKVDEKYRDLARKKSKEKTFQFPFFSIMMEFPLQLQRLPSDSAL